MHTKILIMTRNQAKKIDMYDLVILFFKTYSTIVNAFVPLSDQIIALILKQTTLKALLDEQGYNSKGKTLSKEALRQAMVDLILPMAKRAYGWALTIEDDILESVFNVNEDDFVLKQDSLVVLVNDLLKSLTDNVTALVLYEITMADINIAKDAVLKYITAKETPKQQRTYKKTITANIKKEIKAADKILKICDALMSGKFGKSKSAMLLEYDYSRTIAYSVGRHTKLTVHVYGDEDHSETVEHASIEIASLNRKESTNLFGEGEIVQFRGGHYVLLVKALDFVDQEVDFDIQLGKHVELDVVMVREAVLN